jgi:hypothetical protein
MKRNQVFYVVGALILLFFIAGLFYLQTLEEDATDLQNKYSIEIYNCSPIANDSADLEKEMSAYLTSTRTVSSKGETVFFTPVLKIAKESFCIPIYGMNYIRFVFNSDMYLYSDRQDDEKIFFEGNNASNKTYSRVKEAAMKGSGVDTFPINWPNVKTEFIINKNGKAAHDPRYKVWNSMSNLKVYIDSLFNTGSLTKDSIIKVLYFCGEGYLDDDGDGVPNSKDNCPILKGDQNHNGCPDTDGDGIFDDVDTCPNEKGDVKCDGCICPPPPPCEDKDRDGVCDKVDKCPNEFGLAKYGGCKPPPPPPPIAPKITITHNNSDGTFTVVATNSNGSIAEVKASIEIVQKKGKIVTKDFSGFYYPTKIQVKELFKINVLDEFVDLTVYVVVKDADGKVLKREGFNDMDLICVSSGACGFIDTH